MSPLEGNCITLSVSPQFICFNEDGRGSVGMWTGPCGPRNCQQRYWPEFLRWQSSILPPHCVPSLVRLPGEPNAIGGGTRSASAVPTPGGAACARLCLPICRIKHILWEGMEMDKRSRCCTGWWLLEPTAQLCVDASIAGEAAPWPSRGQVGLRWVPSVVGPARSIMSWEKAALVRPGLRG